MLAEPKTLKLSSNRHDATAVPTSTWQDEDGRDKKRKDPRLHIAITKEADEDGGGYSVVALNISGVQSMGDTIEEAIENVKEAALAVIESYELDGLEIPWTASRVDEIGSATLKWIILNG